jgi:hypothetical protein
LITSTNKSKTLFQAKLILQSWRLQRKLSLKDNDLKKLLLRSKKGNALSCSPKDGQAKVIREAIKLFASIASESTL